MFVGILSGITGEPSELPIGLEACGGTSCGGDMLAMVAAGYAVNITAAGKTIGPRGFLAGVEASGFTSP